MDAILLHSPTAESVLLRKRVSREILFKYLHNNSVPMTLTHKGTMVKKILELWKCIPHEEVILSVVDLQYYSSSFSFWLVEVSSRRLGASHLLCGSSNSWLTNETKQNLSLCHPMYRVGQSASPAVCFTIQKLDDFCFTTTVGFAAFQISAQCHFLQCCLGILLLMLQRSLISPSSG